jgi:pSer/pThr/pTyr-binding forkhead associated (FHA) protein
MRAPGAILQGRYKIFRIGERAGHRVCYDALDDRFGSAVHVLEHLGDGEERARAGFMREARILNAIFHPSLPFVFDAFEEGDSLFYVKRAIPTQNLSRILGSRGEPLAVDEAVSLTLDALGAVVRLHNHKPSLVHGNLTPASIGVTTSGVVQLDEFQFLVEAGEPPLGYTLPFAAPEQIKGMPADARSDVYAIGGLIYFLLTGVLPSTAYERVSADTSSLTPLEAMNLAVPSELSSLVAQALEVDLERRVPSAEELVARLRRFAGLEESAPTPAAPSSERPTISFELRLTPTESIAGVMGPGTTVICRTCGAANDPNRTFCPFCGSLLRADQRAYGALEAAEAAFDGAAVDTLDTLVVDRTTERERLPPDAMSVRLLVVEGYAPGTVLRMLMPETFVGRSDADYIFADDYFMSSRHARIFFEEGGFWLEDLESRNGTFLRIRDRIPLRSGDMFLAGTQLLRFESGARADAGTLRVMYNDGTTGDRFKIAAPRATIGRYDVDVAFPSDASMADYHASIEFGDDAVMLVDTGSHNGTYIRVTGRRRLSDGDILIIGQHMFRFEDDEETSG